MTWTAWGHPDAEHQAETLLGALKEGILQRWAASIKGILVIGGYGRGEGSLLRTEAGAFRPWNDVDLVLLRRSGVIEPPGWDVPALTWAVEQRLDSVDIAWASEDDWRAHPGSLFHVEVRAGHRVLWGDGEATRLLPERMDSATALAEAHRLLANRGYALMLWAIHASVTEAPERLSFRLNALLKSDMALGDARLLAAGRLPVRYADRPAALARLEVSSAVRDAHTEAVEHKLRPREGWALAPRDPAEELARATHLWYSEGPLRLAGVGAEDYPEYVAHSLGSWRRRLKHRLKGGGPALDTRQRLDASLPLLMSGLLEPSGWRPGPLVRLWPDRIDNGTPWKRCAEQLSHLWKELK